MWSDEEGCCMRRKPTGGVTHTDGSPLAKAGSPNHERHEARLAAAQADFAGPIVPRYPEGKA